MNDHIPDVTKMISDTPRTQARVRYMIDNDIAPEGLEHWANGLERELNAANAEIQSLKHNYNRVIGLYTAKDNQICNLLNICRANGIDVSSQDLIHGKEDKL